MILRELWARGISENEVTTTYQYTVYLRTNLEKTCETAREELKRS